VITLIKAHSWHCASTSDRYTHSPAVWWRLWWWWYI